MARARMVQSQVPVVETKVTMPPPAPEPVAEKPPEKLDIFGYMKKLTPEEWKRHIVYVYREEPKTAMMGMGGYLFKTCDPFDEDYIRERYGGRLFKIILKKDDSAITTQHVHIEARPKLDPDREAIPGQGMPNGNRNGDTGEIVKEVVNVLRDELRLSREAASTPNAGNERALEVVTDGAKRVVEMALQNVPQGTDVGKQMRELFAAAKEFGLIGGPQTSTLESLLKELGPLITLLTPLLGKFFTPQNPVEQATQFMTLLDKVEELRGGRAVGARGGTTTNDLILEGIKTLPSVLQQTMEQRQASLQAAALAQQARIPSPGAPMPGIPHSAPPGAAVPSARMPNPAAPAPGNGLHVTPLNRSQAPAPGAGAHHVGAPTNFSDAPSPGPTPEQEAEQYNMAIKIGVAHLFQLGATGEMIALYIDDKLPDMLHDLSRFSIELIRDFFVNDPILEPVTHLPNFQATLRDTKAEIDAIVADAEQDEPVETIQ